MNEEIFKVEPFKDETYLECKCTNCGEVFPYSELWSHKCLLDCIKQSQEEK